MTEPTGSPTGALEKALNEKTVSDLKVLCRHHKIRGYSGKTKAELIALMMEHSAVFLEGYEPRVEVTGETQPYAEPTEEPDGAENLNVRHSGGWPSLGSPRCP